MSTNEQIDDPKEHGTANSTCPFSFSSPLRQPGPTSQNTPPAGKPSLSCKTGRQPGKCSICEWLTVVHPPKIILLGGMKMNTQGMREFSVMMETCYLYFGGSHVITCTNQKSASSMLIVKESPPSQENNHHNMFLPFPLEKKNLCTLC